MKLTFFRGASPNFGDELNATMWGHLLPPGVLDDDEDGLFLGIGSILWDYLPQGPRKVVAGSGWGGYSPPPDVHEGSWDVLWVRGPRTAARLGLDPSLAIADAAVLVSRTPLPPAAPGVGAAFMPHFESVERGDWEAVCHLAGVTFLDPRAPVEDLLAAIRGARVLVSEAMHGAIVADALRTPWLAMTPSHPSHRPKWLDWSESLGIDLRPLDLPPSNLLEAYVRRTGLDGHGARSRRLLDGRHVAPLKRVQRRRAAAALRRAVERAEPQLSRDHDLERATARCEEALDRFARNHERRAA